MFLFLSCIYCTYLVCHFPVVAFGVTTSIIKNSREAVLCMKNGCVERSCFG